MSEKDNVLPPNVREVLRDSYRLAALEASGMFGSKREDIFDQISGKAGLLFRAPVSQVTFLQDENQWLTSSLGFDLQSAPTEISFCAHTIANPRNPTVVLDATLDPRFMNNPYVTDEPFVKFYAGTVIRFGDQNIGTLCVYDFEPREEITSQQAVMLLQLARDVEVVISKVST